MTHIKEAIEKGVVFYVNGAIEEWLSIFSKERFMEGPNGGTEKEYEEFKEAHFPVSYRDFTPEELEFYKKEDALIPHKVKNPTMIIFKVSNGTHQLGCYKGK